VPAWLIWLIVAAGLAGAEALSIDFILIMLAGGAGAGAVAAAVGVPSAGQVVIAIVVAVGLLSFVRPIAKRHLVGIGSQPMHTDALVGKHVIVLQTVDADRGLVRLNGQDWTARAFDTAQSIEVGERAVVVKIEGATAIVWQEPQILSKPLG